jgi:hypothetical protein
MMTSPVGHCVQDDLVVLVSNTEVNRRRRLVEMAIQEEGGTRIDPAHHYKRPRRCHGHDVIHCVQDDLVVLVSNTEVNRRRSLVEMACPPAATLAQASAVLSHLVAAAEAAGERPTVEGQRPSFVIIV